jgi:D-alanyl-lipoteichoic acid acyltransferase DltB (MBOAT superfamily)
MSTFQTLGISYILFRQIDFLLQYQADKIEKIHFILYVNYLLSFWTILSGPIQRYRDFIHHFDSAQVTDFNWEKHLKLFHRMANGLIKIVIISYLLKNQSDKAFTALSNGEYSLVLFLYWLYGYPLYVYLNFSGYCDVIIASAAYSGFSIPENFDRPYLSRNMIEFWNRWHITLSQWVRDFIYQPVFKKLLTSAFKNKLLLSQYISLFITFFIVGIWHGTTINYVIFGLLHGLGMVFSLGYRDVTKKLLGKKKFKTYSTHKGIQVIEIVICLNFVCFTFLFFEYDIQLVFNILGGLFK